MSDVHTNRARSRWSWTLLVLLWLASGLQAQPDVSIPVLDVSAAETEQLLAQQAHPNSRMQFKVLSSRFNDRQQLWSAMNSELDTFGDTRYQALKPYILEQDIPSLQRSVAAGTFSYEDLVLFYLYRIRLYESDPQRYLNALIALNPNAIAEARERDRQRVNGTVSVDGLSIFGIPVLLKDNIGVAGMPTTAGALVLRNNRANDAFITSRLRDNGAIILGKANLSEWAYYFCSGCPLGYSAMGGQTLNPYGRKRIETGGSSSGSAVAVAANYAVAAVGSETSGSILSPSSANALVGLKPSTGMLSRTGIVPISSTLDTPGPIARTVTDAIILFNSMTGYDQSDLAMPLLSTDAGLEITSSSLQGLQGVRLGYFARFLETPLYAGALDRLREQGALLFEVQQPDIQMAEFPALLAGEMKRDLARYLDQHADSAVTVTTVDDVRAFNAQELSLRAPYGQALFDAVSVSLLNDAQLTELHGSLRNIARQVLQDPLEQLDLDALLSINNSHAGFAAISNYPAITVPLGLNDSQTPVALTFIAPSFSEQILVDLARSFEALQAPRPVPIDYQ